MSEILGVTLDFYQTLVRHHSGQGRGASLMQYLAAQGLSSKPWEHQVLYDVFEFYGEAYSPDFSANESLQFWTAFTKRLFHRLDVSSPNHLRPEPHAEAVRDLLGPASLVLYEDALPTLEWLKQRGLPRGVVSNWQHGLSHFCRDLGILGYVDFVVVSAEVGYQKPDQRIFELAAKRMSLPPEKILHVGDHSLEDAEGARAAGMQPALLVRKGESNAPGIQSVRSLTDLRTLPGLSG